MGLTKKECNDLIHKSFINRFNKRLLTVEYKGYKINKHRSMGTQHYSVNLNEQKFGWGFDSENEALIWIEERENIFNSDNPKHPDFMLNFNIEHLITQATELK